MCSAFPLRVFLILLLLAAFNTAGAEDLGEVSEIRTVEGETCPITLPDWATEPERYAWNRICAGDVADMTFSKGVDDKKGCEANAVGDTWPESRVLRSRFIQLIAAREPFVSTPVRPEVRITCARFDEQINLEEELVPHTLWIEKSRIPKGMNLYGARFRRDLSLEGSVFGEGKLSASSVTIGGNLFLRLGKFAEVSLFNTRIEGDVSASGATFSGDFRGSGMSVGGDLFLDEHAEFTAVRITDAKIGGDLDASTSRFKGKFSADGLVVGSDMFLNGNAQFDEVRLIGASIVGDLDASESQFHGSVSADRARVGMGVFLSNGGKFEEVRLAGATIGNNLDASNSEFSGPIEATGMKVAGSVYLNDASQVSAVRLFGADIAGSLSMNGSRFVDVVTADRISVGGDVKLGQKAEFSKLVSLIGAHIDGDVVASGSQFKGSFSGDGMTVNGSLLMRDDAEFATVDLPAATIRGVVQMQTSSFSGPVRLTGLVAKELSLWQGGSTDPKWGEDAILSLRNAEVESLQARIPQSWVKADGTPLPVDLQGFRYERLGGLGSGDDGDLSRIGSAAPLIAWIEAAQPATGASSDHAPQPYFQMESSLRAMGADAAADEVAFARHLKRLRSYGTGFQDWVAWSGEWIWRLLVGFGVYPFRLLWWFAALVILGGYLARKSECLCTRGWRDCFWYSLENAFPLLEPSADNKMVVHERPLVRNFFHFQKVTGFVLATILVGTLTLLAG